MMACRQFAILGVGYFCLAWGSSAGWAQDSVTLRIEVTNAPIRVGDTNIPARLIIENRASHPVEFEFNPHLLCGRPPTGVLLVIPSNVNVRLRSSPLPASIVSFPIRLKPAEKYAADLNLARYIEVTGPGDCEIGLRSNVAYWREGERLTSEPAGTIVADRPLRLSIKP